MAKYKANTRTPLHPLLYC